ncbi:MAG: hypothetical protein M3N02_03110 [Pseudomonadota bacterium]|nr:hypothetical protein [Pseudomonadota bacterium]
MAGSLRMNISCRAVACRATSHSESSTWIIWAPSLNESAGKRIKKLEGANDDRNRTLIAVE